MRLREQLAGSPLDFSSSRHHALIDRDAEQVIDANTTAETTELGWLLGAMMTAQPYVLSVFVHALDRGRERTRLKLSYRRTFMLNRTAEAKGRVPDFDRYAQELASMSSGGRYLRVSGLRWMVGLGGQIWGCDRSRGAGSRAAEGLRTRRLASAWGGIGRIAADLRQASVGGERSPRRQRAGERR